MFESTLAGAAFLVGRATYAAVLGYLAVGNLRDRRATVAYAESKGVPAASVAVPAGSVVLVAGAASILVGVYPLLGALAVLGFLVPVTPTMHDFWTHEGQERANERIHFLKNLGLAGATLVVLATTGADWPHALGVAL